MIKYQRYIPLHAVLKSIILLILILLLIKYIPSYNHIPQSLPSPQQPSEYNHLIIVACHAIFTGDSIHNYLNESQWALDKYQYGTIPTLVQHITTGIIEASNDNKSILLFSGSKTHFSAGPRSEPSSYWNIAHFNNWFGFPMVQERTDLEEYSRDSYENLIFSICRFHQITDNYPEFITVVGFEFKKKRFVDLHRHALRYPLDRFKYIGIDAPQQGLKTFQGEQENAYIPFSNDPYGCTGVLMQKKKKRDRFRRNNPYHDCQELIPVIDICKLPMQKLPNILPWE